MFPASLRHYGRPVVTGLIAGASSASLVLLVDAAVGEPSLVSTGNARTLLGATFAAVVTIGAFAFWMRPLAVQLAASTVPPRAVASHLHDRFQRRVVGVVIGALTFEAVVLLALPTRATDPAPLLASLAGAMVGVAAIAGLLVAIEHAERSTRPSVLISESARRVVEQIRVVAGQGGSISVDATIDDDAVVITAPASGWIRDIDRAGVLRAVPEGGVARMETHIGAFAVEGWTPLVHIGPPAAVTEDVCDVVRSHFEIDDRRDGPMDVTGSLSQFTDIAVQAASGGSSAPSVVYEAMWYLGSIVHELSRHDLSVPGRTSSDGRVLLSPPSRDAAVLTDLAVDRIRRVTASSPEMALELVRVLDDAGLAAARRGRADLVEVLDRQAELAVEQCRHAGGLPSDVERVVAAREQGAGGRAAPGSREEEYDTP